MPGSQIILAPHPCPHWGGLETNRMRTTTESVANSDSQQTWIPRSDTFGNSKWLPGTNLRLGFQLCCTEDGVRSTDLLFSRLTVPFSGTHRWTLCQCNKNHPGGTAGIVAGQSTTVLRTLSDPLAEGLNAVLCMKYTSMKLDALNATARNAWGFSLRPGHSLNLLQVLEIWGPLSLN